MATSLTPEQLQALQAGQQVNTGSQTFMPFYTGQGGTQSGDPTYAVNGYYGWNNSDFNPKGTYQGGAYDLNGNYIAPHTFDASSAWYTNPMLPFAMVAGGMAPALLGSMGAGAAGAAGTAGGLDSAGGVLNGAVMGGAGTGAAGAAGGAAGAGGALETMAALPAYAPAALPAIPEAMGTAAGGGVLSGLASTLGTSPSLLGAGITALGALAGSQGIKQTQNQSQQINPHLAPYVYGDGTASNPGILGYTQGLLNQGMSPQGQAGWQSIMSKGMGLMNQPVAQNGFGLLTKGRY